jgi:hypothetical protein
VKFLFCINKFQASSQNIPSSFSYVSSCYYYYYYYYLSQESKIIGDFFVESGETGNEREKGNNG